MRARDRNIKREREVIVYRVFDDFHSKLMVFGVGAKGNGYTITRGPRPGAG